MAEYKNRFWNALADVRTGMLGLVERREAHSQPMTAHFDGTDGRLWFLAHRDSQLARAIGGGDAKGVFHYTGPGHDLHACLHGAVSVDRDQAVIDKYWSDEAARWFPEGKQSDTVTLIRFDGEKGQVWLDNPDPGDFDPGEGAPEDCRRKIAL